jgi:hypothetical protein
MKVGVPVSPAFVLAERGGGGRGERERGTGAVKNAARQARQAQRAVRRTKKGGRAGSGCGAVAVAVSSLWPMVACSMIAARRPA